MSPGRAIRLIDSDVAVDFAPPLNGDEVPVQFDAEGMCCGYLLVFFHDGKKDWKDSASTTTTTTATGRTVARARPTSSASLGTTIHEF